MTDPDDLIACPGCDALVQVSDLTAAGKARCPRCHRRLVQPGRRAGLIQIGLALLGVGLVAAAMVLPFLSIRRLGLSNDATLLDAALVFDGPLLALSLGVLALIVLVPLARLLLTLYVVVPLVVDQMPAPGARRAFRLSETLRPWSMAEVFAIGAAVALVKLTALARIELGPAFWLLLAFAVVGLLQERYTCRWSIWHALERA